MFVAQFLPIVLSSFVHSFLTLTEQLEVIQSKDLQLDSHYYLQMMFCYVPFHSTMLHSELGTTSIFPTCYLDTLRNSAIISIYPLKRWLLTYSKKNRLWNVDKHPSIYDDLSEIRYSRRRMEVMMHDLSLRVWYEYFHIV